MRSFKYTHVSEGLMWRWEDGRSIAKFVDDLEIEQYLRDKDLPDHFCDAYKWEMEAMLDELNHKP